MGRARRRQLGGVDRLPSGRWRVRLAGPEHGPLPLSRLTTSAVRQWHAALLGDGVGQSTAAKCYRLLRAILNTAIEDRHLVSNPCTIKGAGVEPPDERVIPSVGQVYALA